MSVPQGTAGYITAKPQGGSGWNPYAYGNPVILLDADLGITLNGTDVSTWSDQSGNGNHVSQATEAAQPVYNVSDANFNGHASITFDNSDDYLSRATLVGGALAQPNTGFAVFKYANLTGFREVFDGVGSGNRHTLEGDGANLVVGAGTNATTDTAVTTTSVCGVLFNGASTNSYLNGHAGAGGASGTDALNGLAVGVNLNLTGAFMDGEIAYIIMYDSALSAADISAVGTALAAKYGTTWIDS